MTTKTTPTPTFPPTFANLQLRLFVATSVIAFTSPAMAEAWDDSAKAFKDAMFGDVATYVSIILIGASVVAAMTRKVSWVAIPGAAMLVSVYWMSPAIVAFAKKAGTSGSP